MVCVEGLPRRSGEPSSRSSSLGVVSSVNMRHGGVEESEEEVWQGNWPE